MDNRCLVCLKPTADLQDYHPQCSKRFFGIFPAPKLSISSGEIRRFAAESVLARITVTGVQKKLSISIEGKGADARFIIVGLWGGYILKPPSEEYPYLPENEDAVMRLARFFGIPVVPHALIKLASGELAYICRRIDRTEAGEKLAMEDFCQISERLTEDKYKSSVERLGKLVRRYSVYRGLDAVDFFERIVFCFITGNGDMHLKNYSLIETEAGLRLSAAYDLLCTLLAIPDDPDQSALTINGKRSGLTVNDFEKLAESLEIPVPARRQVYRKSLEKGKEFPAIVQKTFLPERMKKQLIGIFQTRLGTFS